MSGYSQMTRSGLAALFVVMTVVTILAPAAAQETSRLKDLAYLEGTTEEPLVGYGLVVGLGGNGSAECPTEVRQRLVDEMARRGVGDVPRRDSGRDPRHERGSHSGELRGADGVEPHEPVDTGALDVHHTHRDARRHAVGDRGVTDRARRDDGPARHRRRE